MNCFVWKAGVPEGSVRSESSKGPVFYCTESMASLENILYRKITYF